MNEIRRAPLQSKNLTPNVWAPAREPSCSEFLKQNKTNPNTTTPTKPERKPNMSKIKTIKAFKEGVDAAFETLKTRAAA